MSLRGKLKDEISHFTENQASHKFPTGFYIFQVGDRGGGRAGHSVLTEPIGSVLRFSEKFGSSKIGTDRFFLGSRTEQFRFRLVRFGSGSNRTNRSNLKIVKNTRREGEERGKKFWICSAGDHRRRAPSLAVPPPPSL